MDEELELLRPNMIASMALLNKRGFQAATFIDIGAAEGGFYLLRRQMDLFPGAAHFFVDAMQENEPIYRKLVAKFGGGYEIAALSCVEGQLALRIDPDFYNTHVDRLQPTTDYANTRMVPAYTLDSVVGRHKLPAPYALKLDVPACDRIQASTSFSKMVTKNIRSPSDRCEMESIEMQGFPSSLCSSFFTSKVSPVSQFPNDGEASKLFSVIASSPRSFAE